MLKDEIRRKITKLQNKKDRLQNKIYSLESQISYLELELSEGSMPDYYGPGVYVIESHGLYKIGHANDVYNRLAALQTGNPRPLRILGYVRCWDGKEAYELEKKLHANFNSKRGIGEWFELNSLDLECLVKLCCQKINGHLLQVLFDYELYPSNKPDPYIELYPSKEIRDRSKAIKDIVQRLQVEFGGTVNIDLVIADAVKVGLSDSVARSIIDRLRRDGDLFEPRSGVLKVI